MAAGNIYNHIHLENQSVTPKYLQLVNSIIKAINVQNIEKDYILPSINDLSFELDIARATVEKAYRHLKTLGIIVSVPGKGYFIAKTDFIQTYKIFLLFNKLSAHKKIIYDSMVTTLGDKAAIDFYIYRNDFNTFKKLLLDHMEGYTHFVILPHFMDGGDTAHELINSLKGANLILLDKKIAGITRQFGAVYENFEKDIFNALFEMIKHLEKYHTLKIIFPADSYFPNEILEGFTSFCKEYAFNYKIVHDIEAEPIKAGEAYINLMEDDLVILLDKINDTRLKPGKNIGIISYNETPLKRFILNGITTISTDFTKMGETAARMIQNDELTQVEIPFIVNLRASL
jgi:DNA-binding transcriptional regulator YhcF (GntR family)